MGAYVNGKWNELVPNLTPTGGSVGGDPSPDPTNPGISSQPGGSAYTATNGGTSGGGGGSSSSSSQPANQQNLGQIAQNMLGALASGNKAAFDEAVREFNQNYSLDQQKFQASVDQYNQNLAVTAAGLTGTYNGSPTQSAQQQAFNQAATTAGLTGYYTPPGGVGTVANAPTVADFAKQDAATQALYTQYNGANAAQKWVQDATAAMQAAAQQSGGPGAGQIQTLAGQAQQAGLSGIYNGTPTEAARQFNETQALAASAQAAGLSGQYNGNPTEAAREFNQNNTLAAGSLSGIYNGNPTEAARQFNVTAAQAAQNQQDQTTQNYLNLLSGLRGPNDPFQYLRTLQGTPGGLSDIVNSAAGRYQLGGTASGEISPRATIGGQIRNMNNAQSGNYQDPNVQGLPNASQIDPRAYNQMDPSQQAALWAAYEYGGPTGAMRPEDAQFAYKQSLPKYAGPQAGNSRLFSA